MRNSPVSKWKDILLIVSLLTLFPTKLGAKPPAPDLTVVQPMYGSPSGMYLEWTKIVGAQEYQFRKKMDDGNYGEWNNDCRLSTMFKDFFETIPGATYTYQVRVIVNDVESDPSYSRSNTVVKMWPVTISSDCTTGESLELLVGFNQLVLALTRFLHPGIDIAGEEKIDGECVRAPVGGKLLFPVNDDPANMSVDMEVYFNGQPYKMLFGHLENIIDEKKFDNRSVEPGTPLGYITSSHFGGTENNHVHISLNQTWGFRNPLEAWDSDLEQYRDPARQSPRDCRLQF